MTDVTNPPSDPLGIGKLVALVGLPTANYLIQFADYELPHPLTPTMEDIVRACVIGALIWLVPHNVLVKLAGMATTVLSYMKSSK